MEVPSVVAMVLFEVYEESGNLLVVTSSLYDVELQETDVVVKRMWATDGKPIPPPDPRIRTEKGREQIAAEVRDRARRG